ncbi:hypothetical protein, partial [uncultured Holdemanella sp.]|uniref:hypothetical protein n=1 Tax=uncultured Holdemanella sp. TaxID=1763549 RepID=UPI0025CDC1D5
SLSDNPFVFFARCGTNKIAHVSIHHPFAKEELWVKSVSYNFNIAFIGYRKIHLGKIFSSWLSAFRLN